MHSYEFYTFLCIMYYFFMYFMIDILFDLSKVKYATTYSNIAMHN